MLWATGYLRLFTSAAVICLVSSQLGPCDYWAIKEICSPDITLTDAVDRVDQAINVQEAKTFRVRDAVCSTENQAALQSFIQCAINRAKSNYRCLTFNQLVNDTLWRSKVTTTTLWRDSTGLIERIRLISNNPAFNTLSNVLILLFPGSTICDDEQRMYDYAEYRYCMLDYSSYLRSPKCVATEAFLAVDNNQSMTMCTLFEKIIDCVLVGIQSACRSSARNGLKLFYADWIGKELRRIFREITRLKDVAFLDFDIQCNPLDYVSRTLDNWKFTPLQQGSTASRPAFATTQVIAPLLLFLVAAHNFVL